MESIERLKQIASSFAIEGQVQSVSELGQGNVNDTYLVHTDAARKNKYVLQRINHRVFKNPHQIVENIDLISKHIQQKLGKDSAAQSWKVVSLIKCLNGKSLYDETDASIWRMTSFAEGTRTFQKVDSVLLARETGKALGKFHLLLFDLDRLNLHDTLPEFHHTPGYLSRFDKVMADFDESIDQTEIEFCINFIKSNRNLADTLERHKLEGSIATAVIHGDPKINNVLFDETTCEAIGMIDLDTVKPGLLHYDIGDSLRSVCNPTGEEARDPDQVKFNLEFAREWIAGYLESATEILSPEDKYLFYEAVWILSFELGLRFFTDYLEGDVYFKTRFKGQNLKRAKVQFMLANDIEQKESQIRKLIAGF